MSLRDNQGGVHPVNGKWDRLVVQAHSLTGAHCVRALLPDPGAGFIPRGSDAESIERIVREAPYLVHCDPWVPGMDDALDAFPASRRLGGLRVAFVRVTHAQKQLDAPSGPRQFCLQGLVLRSAEWGACMLLAEVLAVVPPGGLFIVGGPDDGNPFLEPLLSRPGLGGSIGLSPDAHRLEAALAEARERLQGPQRAAVLHEIKSGGTSDRIPDGIADLVRGTDVVRTLMELAPYTEDARESGSSDI